MLRSASVVGVLLSALWPRQDGERERWVTWTTNSGKVYETLFTGAVVVCCNKSIDAGKEELQALKTRVPVMHFSPTEQEVRAQMRRIARGGYRDGVIDLEPEEATMVCEYVISQALSLRRPLDLRLLINSFKSYWLWDQGAASCHWHDLVRALVQERPPTVFSQPVAGGTRETRKQAEQEIVRDILGQTDDPQEQVSRWTERTGKSQASFYRRRAELM
jgi:hypothetical protein